MVDQEQHKADCLARWNALVDEARLQFQQYRRKRISRRQLEQWLSQQSPMDERSLRGMLNKLRH